MSELRQRKFDTAIAKHHLAHTGRTAPRHHHAGRKLLLPVCHRVNTELRAEGVDVMAEARTAAGLCLQHDGAGLRLELSETLMAIPFWLREAVTGADRIHLQFRNALGGSGAAAEELLELLRGKQVTATVTDYAASAHALLFALAPGHRRIHPAADVMLHHPAAIVLGTARDLQAAARKLRQQSERWIARLARRTGRPPAEWRDYLESEAVFSAGQAVHLGLADEVFG